MTARAEVVRTPADTPVAGKFAGLAFHGPCNFSLSTGASRFVANNQCSV